MAAPTIKSLQGMLYHGCTLTQRYHQKSVRVFCPKSYLGETMCIFYGKKERIHYHQKFQ